MFKIVQIKANICLLTYHYFHFQSNLTHQEHKDEMYKENIPICSGSSWILNW